MSVSSVLVSQRAYIVTSLAVPIDGHLALWTSVCSDTAKAEPARSSVDQGGWALASLGWGHSHQSKWKPLPFNVPSV